MSSISFRVNSVELEDFTLRSINKENLIRLNVIQRPSKVTYEYLLKNSECLKDINHEFSIDNSSNKIDKLTFMISSVVRKPTLVNLFDFGSSSPKNKSNDQSYEKCVNGSKENDSDHVDCEYIVPMHALIGYCTIKLKEIEKGVNNSLRVELLTKKNAKVIGFVNLDIYIWDGPKQVIQQKKSQLNDEKILFVDPECPVSNI